MRFLRMLTNSLLAGALGAAYLTVLVLQLNPQIPIASDTTLRWLLTFVLFYGVHLAVLFYLMMMAREFFSMDTLSPGWASVRVLAWLAAALAAAAAALMWLNVRGFEAALGEVATRRMTSGAAATTASAVVLLGIAVAHYSFGRRGSRVGAALFAIAAFGSLALPLAARGPAARLPHARSTPTGVTTAAAGARVVMLLLDGASLEYVRLRAADGRLPNFSKMLDRGATLDLATVRPPAPDRCGRRWPQVFTPPRPACARVRRTWRGVRPRRSTCCRITASRTRWCTSASFARRRTPPKPFARGPLEHPLRRRHPGRRRSLAADLSRVVGARIHGERPVPRVARFDARARCARGVSRNGAARRPPGVCSCPSHRGAGGGRDHTERGRGPGDVRDHARPCLQPHAEGSARHLRCSIRCRSLPGARHRWPLLHGRRPAGADGGHEPARSPSSPAGAGPLLHLYRHGDRLGARGAGDPTICFSSSPASGCSGRMRSNRLLAGCSAIRT